MVLVHGNLLIVSISFISLLHNIFYIDYDKYAILLLLSSYMILDMEPGL